jgi:hypothetical protein
MTKTFAIAFTALFYSAALSPARAADYRRLDVKTGQWENTLTGQASCARTEGVGAYATRAINNTVLPRRANFSLLGIFQHPVS